MNGYKDYMDSFSASPELQAKTLRRIRATKLLEPMWPRVVGTLAAVCMIAGLFVAGYSLWNRGEVIAPPIGDVSSAPDQPTPPAVSASLVDTMPDADYRELNKVLTEVQEFPGLPKMNGEEDFILFAAYVAMYKTYANDSWGAQGSKEAVERVLNRYFGVEKVNHTRSALYRSWDDWDVDYPIDGVSSLGSDWVNVTSLWDAGNGTLIAKADLYFSFGTHWDESWLGPVSQWSLKPGAIMTDTDYDTLWNEVPRLESNFESGDIYRYGTCTVTVKPFVYEGEQTWQIAGINGIGIPTVLFKEEELQTIYGEYTLLKTLDAEGNGKTPEAAVSSLTLKEDDTYTLIFEDGNEDILYADNRSAGRMRAHADDDYPMADGLAEREWQFELRDDRNDDEPSYVFIIETQDDGSICVLWIPQGVGDDSWLAVADFWVMEKSSGP